MLKRLLYFGILLTIGQVLNAQCTIITLSSQDDVDSYPSFCTEPDFVTITGADITNLDALSVITRIDDNLVINDGLISNLEGLNNITEIGGNLQIYQLDNLGSLEGLESLVSVGGTLGIYQNPNLTSLEGLNNLETVGGIATLGSGNYANCSGLESLEQVGGLTISATANLRRLDGLNNLRVIENNLNIANVNDLESIEGLERLESCRNLSITSNDYLPCLAGLENLTTVTGNIEINSNGDLLSLTGLEGLTFFDGDLEIRSNVNLSICNLPSICTMINQASSVNISNNTPACSDVALIQMACANYGECPENIELNTQAQIDMFATIFPNCSDIQGDLLLAIGDPRFNNFNGLSPINSIGGNLRIEGTTVACQDFMGFHALETIGGNLDIYYAPSVQNLSGFDALRSIGGILAVTGNQSLLNLEGLHSLDTLGRLELALNLNLLNLRGLEGIRHLPQGLLIFEETGITSFEGLNNLETTLNLSLTNVNGPVSNLQGLNSLRQVADGLRIRGFTNLQSLQGLEQLESVGALLSISDCQALHNLNGLEGLVSVGELSIDDNDNLSSLAGLDDCYFLADNISISRNNILSDCAVWPICNHFANAGTGVFTFNNGGSCEDESSLLAACNETQSLALGKVYADLNCNAVFDGNDVALNNRIVRNVANNAAFAVTDDNGNYRGFLPPSSSFQITVDALPGYELSPMSHELTTTTDPLAYGDLDFALCAQMPVHNLQAELTPLSPPRPGFTNSYQVCFQNVGSAAEDATLMLSFAPLANEDDLIIIDGDDGQIMGDEVTWEAIGALPFETVCYTVMVQISASVPLGTLLGVNATVVSGSNDPELDEEDNTSSLLQTVVGSYDPNDKQVFPAEIPNTEISDDFTVEYLIRFQNTGTFPASFIEVLDTIMPPLDISSLRVLAASHDYDLSFPEEHVVSWFFRDINLPDSTSNEPESHGFIKFRIGFLEPPALGDVFLNRAGIYFDFNEPIITNYAEAEVILPNSVIEILPAGHLQLMPNPTSSTVLLQLEDFEGRNAQATILNENGQVMERFRLQASSTQIDVSAYPAGVYFVQVQQARQVAVARLIVLP